MTSILATGGGGRISITFSPEASDIARVMAADLGVEVPELVRRSLGLMRMWMALDPGEELMVRRANGRLDRLILERGPGHE